MRLKINYSYKTQVGQPHFYPFILPLSLNLHDEQLRFVQMPKTKMVSYYVVIENSQAELQRPVWKRCATHPFLFDGFMQPENNGLEWYLYFKQDSAAVKQIKVERNMLT